jgi:hypothetical protein
MTTPGRPLSDAAADVLRRVHTVPDDHREFSVPPAEAARTYGIDEPLLAYLLGLGLPHRGTGTGSRFDPLDLENVAFGLTLNSAQRLVVSRWSRFLGPAVQRQRGHYLLRISWKCPDPGHGGPCDFAVTPLLPAVTDAARPGATARPDPGRDGTVIARVDPQWYDRSFPAAFRPVAVAARELTFHRIPRALAGDLGYLRATGLADCQLGNRHLMGIARAAGLTVRPASGYFVGAPFPGRHVWFEILLDDTWVPADPFFLDTLARWGVVRPSAWPLTRSPRNVLVRLETSDSVDSGLVTHQGRTAPLTIVARWQPSVTA